MFALAFFTCLPIAPFAEFDERALPTCHADDLLRFHDPLLAIQHGAEARQIQRLIEQWESRWWDTAGFDHEYQIELRRLRLARACWSQLEDAARPYSDEWQADKLAQLRRLLGPQLYYAGRMPDFPAAAMCLPPPTPDLDYGPR